MTYNGTTTDKYVTEMNLREVTIESVYICIPLNDKSGYITLVDEDFWYGPSLVERSTTHTLYACSDVGRKISICTPLTLRRLHSNCSYNDTEFTLTDLVTGSHQVRDLFPNDVDTSSYTMSMSCDDYTIEVHYKAEDNV